MRGAQVIGHRIGIVEIGDRGGEVGLPREKDVLRATCEIQLILFSKCWEWKGTSRAP